jgi:hypothetical protein
MSPVCPSIPRSVAGGRRLLATTLGALVALALSAAPAFAAAPEEPVTITPAKSITGTTAILEGTLNPGGEAMDGWYFAYAPGPECIGGLTTTQEPEADAEAQKESKEVTGLEPDKTYKFCLVAINASGEATAGNEVSFKTAPAKPEVAASSESAAPVTPIEESLSAEVNADNQQTLYAFEYSTEATGETLEGAITTVDGEAALPAEFGARAVSVLTGPTLEPSTTYYYRIVATNQTGTTDGTVGEFETEAVGMPMIENESAVAITQTSASLSALINPEFQETTCKGFELSGTTAPCEPENLGSGGTGVTTSASLTGLQPNTEYGYKALAENGSGLSEGSAQTFVTLPEPPTVSTGAPTAGASSATVTGTVNPDASGQPLQDDTIYYFQYGHSTNYGGQAPAPSGDAGEGEGAKEETATLSGLEPNSTYHYRIVASNDNDGIPQIVYGDDKTLTTSATPPILLGLSISALSQTSVTFDATIDPQGLPTRYELQLGSTPGVLEPVAAGDANSTTPLTLSVGSLSPGTVYYYKLIATNPSGSSEPEEGSFTTVPGPPPPLVAALPFVPYTPIATLDAKEATENERIGKPLTNAQKLGKALQACKKDKKKSKRVACEKIAHKRYPTAKRKARK